MVKTSSCGCLLDTVNLCAIYQYSAFPSILLFDYKLSKVDSVPPIKKSVCLVVSPLVSLMVDQVISQRSKGVHAAILSGNKGIAKCEVTGNRQRNRGWYTLSTLQCP